MNQEIWKDIPGYEGLYQASNIGNIKSKNKFIKGRKLGKGKDYIRVCLYKNKIGTNYSAHRLVAQSFIPNPENKPQVNHKNGIKTDNRVENLEWNTISENNKHKFRILGYKNNIQKGQNLVYKNIGQYDMEGKLVKIWESFDGISTSGFHRASVYLVLKNKRKSYKNFIWKLI